MAATGEGDSQLASVKIASVEGELTTSPEATQDESQVTVWYKMATNADKTLYIASENKEYTYNGMTITPDKEAAEGSYPWNAWASRSKENLLTEHIVVLDDLHLNTCARLFEGLAQAQDIAGLDHLTTAQVTDFSYMFSGLREMKNLDASMLDTSAGTTFEGMFFTLGKTLNSGGVLNVTGFDTSKGTNLNSMFSGVKLTIVGASALNTSSAEDFTGMFRECGATELDISGYDMSNAKNVESMFYSMVDLKHISLPKRFITSSVQEADYLFGFDNKLESVECDGWDFSGVESSSQGVNNLFMNCESLKSIDLHSCNFSNVKSAQGMFKGCKNLETADLSGCDFSSCRSFYNAFQNCKNLKTVNLSNVTFLGSSSNMGGFMSCFKGCASLEAVGPYVEAGIKTAGLNLLGIKSFASMFDSCTSLKSVNLSGMDVSEATQASSMFKGCTNLETVNLSGWKAQNATTFEGIFSGCSNLSSVNLDGFEAPSVSTSSSMFSNCAKLTAIDLTGFAFNKDKATAVSMFNGCESLAAIYVAAGTDWTWLSAAKSKNMFNGCTALKGGNVLATPTVFDSSAIDSSRAIVDGFDPDGKGARTGYFSVKASGAAGKGTATVTYNTNRPAHGTTDSTETPAAAVIAGNPVTLETPGVSYEGYDFVGWATESGDVVASYDGAVFEPATWRATTDCKLFAQWNEKSYGVKYDVNGGNEGTAPADQVKCHFSNLRLSADKPVKSFKATVEITLDYNDGKTANGVLQTDEVTSVEFVKWTVSADGTGQDYYPGSYYAVNEFATLHAQWSDVKQVSYAAVELPSADREGFELTGWMDEAGDVHAAGEKWQPTKVTTLTAQWKPAKKQELSESEVAVLVTRDVNEAIGKMTDADDLTSLYNVMQLRVSKSAKNAITLKWKAAPGAVKYVVLGSKCGKKYAKLAEKTSTGFVHKGLSKKTSYKYVVLAYDKAGKRIGTAKTVHAYTKGGKFGNVKKVKLAKKVKLTLKANTKKSIKAKKTIKLKGEIVKAGKKLQQHRKLRYESSNQDVATVNAKTGKVTAKKKGTCFIWAYATDGTAAKCKVTVK